MIVAIGAHSSKKGVIRRLRKGSTHKQHEVGDQENNVGHTQRYENAFAKGHVDDLRDN